MHSLGRGVQRGSEFVEVLSQVSLVYGRVGSLYRHPGVAVGSTLISGESIAKAGGVWSRVSGFLGSFCGRIGVRGVCGGREGTCCEGCWVRQGLRPVTGSLARVSRAGPNALGCVPVQFC